MKLTIESYIPLECRKVYIIETRRPVQETIKENNGDIRLGQNPLHHERKYDLNLLLKFVLLYRGNLIAHKRNFT